MGDAGRGFSPAFDARIAAHTGLDLALSLAGHDLRGTNAFTNDPEGGACVHVNFLLPVMISCKRNLANSTPRDSVNGTYCGSDGVFSCIAVSQRRRTIIEETPTAIEIVPGMSSCNSCFL